MVQHETPRTKGGSSLFLKVARNILWRVPVSLATLLNFFAPRTCTAQALYGTLLGNVTDATGAVVPGATVTILHKETSQIQRTTTNDNGGYGFPTIPTGTYDWSVLMVLNCQETGTPVVLSVPGDVANVSNLVKTYARPNVIGDPNLADRSMNMWFNTSAFAVPVLSFGAAGRGLIRNPNFYNSDMSLFKNIPLKEKFTLQVRGEFFNAFNIINPGNANGT